MTRSLLVLCLSATLIVSGCSREDPALQDPAVSTERPTSTAKVTILEPAAGAVVTGPDLKIKLGLEGGKVIAQQTSALKPDEGHIHLTLDGQLVAMTFELEHTAKITPGSHLLQAEFVAGDHAPFSPRVIVVKSFDAQ